MSDETTTERHEPVQDGYREHCGTCWRGVEVSAPPGEVRYRVSRAPWPCENARLRERAAALEAACYEAEVEGGPRSFSGFFCRLCGWDCSPDFKAEHEPSCVLYEADAALAQADDGGRA